MQAGSVVEAIQIREIQLPREIEAAQRLRFEVWRAEGAEILNPESEKIADAHDEHAIHWGAFCGDRMVGSARMCVHQDVSDTPDAYLFEGLKLAGPAASINRLVVLKAFRGNGIGQSLDKIRINRAKQSRARYVLAAPIDVQSRQRALSTLGFESVSGVTGRPNWSSAVVACAYYLALDPPEGASK